MSFKLTAVLETINTLSFSLSLIAARSQRFLYHGFSVVARENTGHGLLTYSVAVSGFCDDADIVTLPVMTTSSL